MKMFIFVTLHSKSGKLYGFSLVNRFSIFLWFQYKLLLYFIELLKNNFQKAVDGLII